MYLEEKVQEMLWSTHIAILMEVAIMKFRQIIPLAVSALLGMQAPLCAMQQQPPSDEKLKTLGRKTLQSWSAENRNRPQTANSDDFILWTPRNGLNELYQLIGRRIHDGEEEKQA